VDLYDRNPTSTDKWVDVARGPRGLERPLSRDPARRPLQPPRERLSRPAGLRLAELRLGLGKWDFGLRLAIVKRLDLTLEYSLHDIAASRKIRHDEALATLRLKL
jgi:hypothetical protein